jgi:hypothetical protein
MSKDEQALWATEEAAEAPDYWDEEYQPATFDVVRDNGTVLVTFTDDTGSTLHVSYHPIDDMMVFSTNGIVSVETEVYDHGMEAIKNRQ